MSELRSPIERAIAGDSDALARLLAEHGPVVARSLEIARPWRAVLDVDDVMQVTYLEAFLQIGRFDPARGSFEAWLATIARHNLLDAVRGLSRAKQPQPRNRISAPLGDSSVELLDLLGVTTTTPSRVARHHERTRALERAIDLLPADYGRVIRLYDLEGRHADEVAATLNRSPGAVHMLRARAHDALRERLGAESEYFSRKA